MKQSVARARDGGKAICLLPEERVDVGVDVHKESYSVTVWSEARQQIVSHWVQPAIPGVLIRRLGAYDGHLRRVVYEAGPTGYGLVRALRRGGFEAEVIAPSRTPRRTGPAAKSDRLDSRQLAMWSAKGLVQPVRAPTEVEEGDRQVFRLRQQLLAKRRRVKQQIKSFLLQYGIAEPEGLAHWTKGSLEGLSRLRLRAPLRFALDLLLEELAHCEGLFQRADRAVRELAGQRRHRQTARVLQTVPGVGAITAMVVRTELLAPERFGNGREVAAMTGLAPLVMRSGGTVREGSLMRGGNTRLRTALIEAAWRWVAHDAGARERYGHLLRTTGEPNKAIAAMARRLIIILWRMSLTGEPYRPRCEGQPQAGQPGLNGQSPKGQRAPSRPQEADRRRPLSVQTPG